MLKHMMSLMPLLSCYNCICAQAGAHKPLSIYNNYPWQGIGGYNLGMSYNGRPAIDAGIMVSDIPRPGSKAMEDFRDGIFLANQNLFFNTELTLDRNYRLLAGPKAGYEINYVFFTGRLSDVCYTRPAGAAIDNRLLLEGGATLFGYVNLCYGYSLPTQARTFEEINRHRITLRVNIFREL